MVALAMVLLQLFLYDFPKVKSEINIDRGAIVQNALKAFNEGWHYLQGVEGEKPNDGTGYPPLDNRYQMREEGELDLKGIKHIRRLLSRIKIKEHVRTQNVAMISFILIAQV